MIACCWLLTTNDLWGKDSSWFWTLVQGIATAFTLIALVVISWRQGKELQRTKKENARALLDSHRVQASGLRLISLAIGKDPNVDGARRELELLLEGIEKKIQREIS